MKTKYSTYAGHRRWGSEVHSLPRSRVFQPRCLLLFVSTIDRSTEREGKAGETGVLVNQGGHMLPHVGAPGTSFFYVAHSENKNKPASTPQATMKNLQTKVHALDQEQTRQQELIYSAEFQIQQMERKVARGMGERTDEEKSQLNSKIRELEVGTRVP